MQPTPPFVAVQGSESGTKRRLEMSAFAPLVGLSGNRSALSIYEYTPFSGRGLTCEKFPWSAEGLIFVLEIKESKDGAI